jgi:hypothetical protein
VKQHGLICGDDYSLGGWWGDGIVRAVHKFVSESPVKIELVLGSQFAIRKLPADEVHQDAQEPAKTRGMFGKLGEAVSRKLG